MMERTESCFFVKQSLPKGLMGAFLLFDVYPKNWTHIN